MRPKPDALLIDRTMKTSKLVLLSISSFDLLGTSMLLRYNTACCVGGRWKQGEDDDFTMSLIPPLPPAAIGITSQ